MTIKQQFRSKFNKCVSDLNNNQDKYTQCLLKLDSLEKEYEDKYKQLLEGCLFVNVDNTLFLVKKVYVDTNSYNTSNMPQVMTEMYVVDCLDGFNYKSDLLTGTLTEWYEDKQGKKVVQELKCDNFLKTILCKVIKDCEENKVKLKKKHGLFNI